MVSGLFDDHYEALVHWREAGLKGLTCLHVDAHLDVMDVGFTQETLDGVAAAKNREELEPFRGSGQLPWGGCHCGNYLYPALLDGTVGELIWVLPPHLITGESFLDGVRHETQRWVDLRFQEWKGMHQINGRIEGTLAGRKFTVCTTDSLPTLSEQQKANLALDIDIDYFVRVSDDKIWQTPHQLQQALGKLEPKALTIAYSIDGGYTPLGDRYLGEVTRDVFSGQPQAWREELARLREFDEQSPEARQASLEAMLAGAPDWLRPSLLAKLERYDEAAQLDPAFTFNALNPMARLLQKKDYQAGLDQVKDYEPGTERAYLQTFFALGANQPGLAKESLSLLEQESQTPPEMLRVLYLKAGCCCDLEEFREALELLGRAHKIDKESKEVHYQSYRAYLGLGERKKAARSLRKSLRLAEGCVSSLQMLVDAAKLYDQLGQKALAKATRRQLKECDVLGAYTVRSMLDEAKLS